MAMGSECYSLKRQCVLIADFSLIFLFSPHPQSSSFPSSFPFSLFPFPFLFLYILFPLSCALSLFLFLPSLIRFLSLPL